MAMGDEGIGTRDLSQCTVFKPRCICVSVKAKSVSVESTLCRFREHCEEEQCAMHTNQKGFNRALELVTQGIEHDVDVDEPHAQRNATRRGCHLSSTHADETALVGVLFHLTLSSGKQNSKLGALKHFTIRFFCVWCCC